MLNAIVWFNDDDIERFHKIKRKYHYLLKDGEITIVGE
jgi:hypothetical protein